MKNIYIKYIFIIFIGIQLFSCQTAKFNGNDNNYVNFVINKEDSISDLYYNYWKPATSINSNLEKNETKYLDIKEISISSSINSIEFKIKTKSSIKDYVVSENAKVEWGFYIDEDRNVLSGKLSPTTSNDIGPEYKIALIRIKNVDKCEFVKLRNSKILFAEYIIDNDVIKFIIPKESINTSNFNIVAYSIKTYIGNNVKMTQAIDTVPNTGHYNSLDNQDKDIEFPLKVEKYLSQNFSIRSRPSRLFRISIDSLFEEKYGDCDEYAILAMYMLRKNGIEAYLLQVDFNEWWPEYNTYKRHDICIFKNENQKWDYIDIYDINKSIGKNEYSTIEEICSKLPSHYKATDWTKFNVYDNFGEIVNSF